MKGTIFLIILPYLESIINVKDGKKWAAIFLLGREQYSLYIILGVEEREK